MKIVCIFKVENKQTLHNPNISTMKKSILSFDYYFQMITFGLIMSTSIMIFPLLLLVPFGAYQVLSAGTKGIVLNNYRHRIFALAAGLYGTAIMYIGFGGTSELRDFFNLFNPDFIGVLTVSAFFILPIISAVYYIRQSYKDWQAASVKEVLV